ncbi:MULTISPECIES: tetratricopeptide repeat protein [Pedobacter]|uniref:tetratricopeptide repeat protein n=1 Tax=Pedobacter TaxID=84567 RepID=UPI00210C939A|nr:MULTISPECIES: tetratricopeptide repeat protein [unclassified Pedobacter]
MNHLKLAVFILLLSSSSAALSQANNYDRLAMRAMLKGDYKAAVTQLEKAEAKDPSNANILKMLGYSYYQCGNFDHAISAYSRFINVKPSDYSAYYYRGKARLNVANDPKESSNQLREGFYLASIKDFSKAIEINGEEDPQLLQNRGLAYKDYAIYKSYKIKRSSDKAGCLALFNNSISDFNKILLIQPQRKDIVSLVDYVKAQIASLK